MAQQIEETTAIEQRDPMVALIERVALTPDFDVLKLRELLEMKKDWERDEARKAFYAAMKRFKDNPPRIEKNATVSFGQGKTSYSHATLDEVCNKIISALAAVGITHKWKPLQRDGVVSVACILTHEFGFSDPEPPALEAAPDNSGSKNPVQAIASTVTYLERYTLLAAVGMAVSGQDDDAHGTHVTNGEVMEWVDWLSSAKDLSELQKVFADVYKKAQEQRNQGAMQALIQAKNKRKAELQ